MDVVLRGLHIGLGELGLLCIILVLVEVAWGASGRSILRAKSEGEGMDSGSGWRFLIWDCGGFLFLSRSLPSGMVSRAQLWGKLR